MRKSTYLFITVLLFFANCKSSQKLFQEGKYERSFFSALDDLKKNPTNTNAIQILPEAYSLASRQLLAAIDDAKYGSTTSTEKLDRVYSSYSSLQKMYNGVQSVPAIASKLSATDYSYELRSAANDAASAHYEKGLDFMDLNDRISFQKAHKEFLQTEKYVQGFKDVSQLKEQALDLATANVIVNSINQQFGSYSVNGSFLENDIVNDLNSIGRNYYYKFYPIFQAQSRQVRADQFMDIQMYDIWFGALATNSYSYDVSKTVKESATNTKDAPKSVTVKATVRVTRRIIDSRAAMDCRVSDAESRRIIFTERFPSRYTWEKLTGSYTGDSRALGDKDWAIIRGVYNNAPDYNELYRELTRQIMNNFNSRMRQLYGR